MISIITVTYNAASTIRDCLGCVENQTAEVEHILIDGLSDDSTLEIVREYGNSLAQIISEPDKGVS